MELLLDRLTKHYGSKIAVDQVSAVLEPGGRIIRESRVK